MQRSFDHCKTSIMNCIINYVHHYKGKHKSYKSPKVNEGNICIRNARIFFCQVTDGKTSWTRKEDKKEISLVSLLVA